MFVAFEPIRSRISKFLKYQDVYVDNAIFRLHCHFTMAILAAGSIFLTAGQLMGKPMECLSTTKEGWKDVINTYCWVMTTFVMPEAFDEDVSNFFFITDIIRKTGTQFFCVLIFDLLDYSDI